jgi:hypothetical protein
VIPAIASQRGNVKTTVNGGNFTGNLYQIDAASKLDAIINETFTFESLNSKYWNTQLGSGNLDLTLEGCFNTLEEDWVELSTKTDVQWVEVHISSNSTLKTIPRYILQ